ncbi:MAG: ATP-binding protein, partial [Candidatus Poribacteria bacterium]
MPSLFYPPSLRQLFTNRQKELDFLQQIADDLVAGRRRFVAIFGLRRIGKTMLLLEQLTRLLSSDEIVPVYINCEDICSSPEIFSQRYVGMTLFWALTRGEGDMDAFLTTARLLRSSAMSVSAVSQTAVSFASEFAQSQPDTALIVKQAFDFPQRLAHDLNKKIILFIDEFPEITVLSHYPRIGDPLKLFRASLIAQPDVAVVCAGSAIHAMETMFAEHSSPLFLQFEMLSLAPFTREETLQLSNKLLDNLSSVAAR